MKYKNTIKFPIKNILLRPTILQEVATYQHLAKCAQRFKGGFRHNYADGIYLTFGGPYSITGSHIASNIDVVNTALFYDFYFGEERNFRKQAGLDYVYHTKTFIFRRRCNKDSVPDGKLRDIIKNILTIQPKERLKFSPNNHWPKADWIIKKHILVYHNCFRYRVIYSTFTELLNSLKNKAISSWDITIDSLPNECFEDFIVRLSECQLNTAKAPWRESDRKFFVDKPAK
jgi:hypothetical protein